MTITIAFPTSSTSNSQSTSTSNSSSSSSPPPPRPQRPQQRRTQSLWLLDSTALFQPATTTNGILKKPGTATTRPTRPRTRTSTSISNQSSPNLLSNSIFLGDSYSYRNRNSDRDGDGEGNGEKGEGEDGRSSSPSPVSAGPSFPSWASSSTVPRVKKRKNKSLKSVKLDGVGKGEGEGERERENELGNESTTTTMNGVISKSRGVTTKGVDGKSLSSSSSSVSLGRGGGGGGESDEVDRTDSLDRRRYWELEEEGGRGIFDKDKDKEREKEKTIKRSRKKGGGEEENNKEEEGEKEERELQREREKERERERQNRLRARTISQRISTPTVQLSPLFTRSRSHSRPVIETDITTTISTPTSITGTTPTVGGVGGGGGGGAISPMTMTMGNDENDRIPFGRGGGLNSNTSSRTSSRNRKSNPNNHHPNPHRRNISADMNERLFKWHEEEMDDGDDDGNNNNNNNNKFEGNTYYHHPNPNPEEIISFQIKQPIKKIPLSKLDGMLVRDLEIGEGGGGGKEEKENHNHHNKKQDTGTSSNFGYFDEDDLGGIGEYKFVPVVTEKISKEEEQEEENSREEGKGNWNDSWNNHKRKDRAFIGKGKFSDVRLAEKGGKKFALKHTALHAFHPLIAARLLREPEILSELPPHPNLVRGYETIRTGGHLYLVEEYLKDYVSLESLCISLLTSNSSPSPSSIPQTQPSQPSISSSLSVSSPSTTAGPQSLLSPKQLLSIFHQLLHVTRTALHPQSTAVCHRDIKPENVLVRIINDNKNDDDDTNNNTNDNDNNNNDTDNEPHRNSSSSTSNSHQSRRSKETKKKEPRHHVVLVDFGLASHYSTSAKRLTTCCGSPAFHSPEMWTALQAGQNGGEPKSYWGPEVDVWCIGLTLLRCAINRKFPIGPSHSSLHSMHHKVSQALNLVTDSTIHKILSRLLDINGERRLSWFNQYRIPKGDDRFLEKIKNWVRNLDGYDGRSWDLESMGRGESFKLTSFVPTQPRHLLNLPLASGLPLGLASRSAHDLLTLEAVPMSSISTNTVSYRGTGFDDSPLPSPTFSIPHRFRTQSSSSRNQLHLSIPSCFNRNRPLPLQIVILNPDKEPFSRVFSFLKYALRCAGILYHVVSVIEGGSGAGGSSSSDTLTEKDKLSESYSNFTSPLTTPLQSPSLASGTQSLDASWDSLPPHPNEKVDMTASTPALLPSATPSPPKGILHCALAMKDPFISGSDGISRAAQALRSALAPDSLSLSVEDRLRFGLDRSSSSPPLPKHLKAEYERNTTEVPCCEFYLSISLEDTSLRSNNHKTMTNGNKKIVVEVSDERVIPFLETAFGVGNMMQHQDPSEKHTRRGRKG